MMIDSNFTIAHDQLSRYLDTRDRNLLNAAMLRIEHGRIVVCVGFYESAFKISAIENQNYAEPIATLECHEEQLGENLSEMCRMALDYDLAMQDNSLLTEAYSEFYRTIRDNKLQLEFIEGDNKTAILTISTATM